MLSKKQTVAAIVSLVALTATLPLGATTLLQMDLAELTGRADKIFRGTVVDVEQGSVALGGGDIPVVTYKLRVEEMLKGSPDATKGDASMVEVRMVGSIKPAVVVGTARHLSALYDVPRLKMGRDYLLFTTPPSQAGLSTTVGLGQGAFDVFSRDKEDYAQNQFGNLGLGLGADGPAVYSELAAKINALLGQ